MNENDVALEAFSKAREDDGLVSPTEQKELLSELSLKDWQLLRQAYSPDENILSLIKRPVITETPTEFLVHNDEHRLRISSVLTDAYALGRTGFLTGMGYGAGRLLFSSYRPARFIAAGIGLLSGCLMHREDKAEINEIKAQGLPLRIQKADLK